MQEPMNQPGTATDSGPKKPPPLPALIWMLAIFGILLGGCGMMQVAGSWISMGIDDDMMSAVLRMSGMPDMEKQLEQLEQEMQGMQRYGGTNMNSMMEQAQKLSDKLNAEIVPYPAAVNLGEALLSLMALAAGIGLLMRKRWAWLMEIWLLVLATVFTIVVTGFAIEGMMMLYDALMEMLYSGPAISMPWLGPTLYIMWAALSAILILLHGLIIYYLYRPNIRRIYEPQRYGQETVS